MSGSADPNFLAALIGSARSGAFYYPQRCCDICGKPIQTGEAYRDILGVGQCHIGCDPRDKNRSADTQQSS